MIGNTDAMAAAIMAKYGQENPAAPAATQDMPFAVSHAQPYGAVPVNTGNMANATNGMAPTTAPSVSVVRTGTDKQGRKVAQMSDGTITFQ